MEGPGIRPVENETRSQASRKTTGGKTFTYKLEVIQQPERARACGSGAKSSADRRPVDPPPIVQLKLFEGEPGDPDPKDVTFSQNSNFFLYASLEQARHVAHGRVPQDQKSPPVLTGAPVAGIVYLERPTPAGYFIFPDLSVRHEGKYRIAFSLFEETKDAKDEDHGDDGLKRNTFQEGFVSQRLEVKSKPFMVFSAKKFPGLAESTSLSRIVAEQGCRVRIRRDVRMRRRSEKYHKDWDGYEDATADVRGRMSATPEASSSYQARGFSESRTRPRSSSNSSHPLAPSLSRRPSMQEQLTPGYPQPSYGTAPNTPQNAYSHSSPYAAAPPPSAAYPQPQFPQHASSMQPPPSMYQVSHPHQPTLHPAPPPQQPYSGYGAPPPLSGPQSHFAAPSAPYDVPGQAHRPSVDYSPLDQRRSSAMFSTAAQAGSHAPSGYQPQQAPAYSAPYPGQHVHHSLFGSTDTYSRPAPAEPSMRASAVHTPLPARPFNDKLPPLNTTFSMSGLKPIEANSPVSSSHVSTSYYPSAVTPMDSHKRNYGQVFSDRHQAQPLRQGARPSPTTLPYLNTVPGLYTAEDDAGQDLDDDDGNSVKMIYRRADGRQVNRNLPAHAG